MATDMLVVCAIAVARVCDIAVAAFSFPLALWFWQPRIPLSCCWSGKGSRSPRCPCSRDWVIILPLICQWALTLVMRSPARPTWPARSLPTFAILATLAGLSPKCSTISLMRLLCCRASTPGPAALALRTPRSQTSYVTLPFFTPNLYFDVLSLLVL